MRAMELSDVIAENVALELASPSVDCGIGMDGHGAPPWLPAGSGMQTVPGWTAFARNLTTGWTGAAKGLVWHWGAAHPESSLKPGVPWRR
jgi:hypothetical protein